MTQVWAANATQSSHYVNGFNSVGLDNVLCCVPCVVLRGGVLPVLCENMSALAFSSDFMSFPIVLLFRPASLLAVPWGCWKCTWFVLASLLDLLMGCGMCFAVENLPICRLGHFGNPPTYPCGVWLGASFITPPWSSSMILMHDGSARLRSFIHAVLAFCPFPHKDTCVIVLPSPCSMHIHPHRCPWKTSIFCVPLRKQKLVKFKCMECCQHNTHIINRTLWT